MPLPAYFRQTIHYSSSPVLTEYDHPGNLVTRHMRGRAAAITVYVYADDSPVSPGEAFPVFGHGASTPAKWSYVRSTYWGNGSWNPVQLEEDIAALEAAGYTVIPGVPPDSDPPVPEYPGDSP